MDGREEVLNDARRAVLGPRADQYGHPRVNLDDRTARMFTAYLWDLGIKRPLDGRDVANLMILVKIARLQQGDGAQFDSWTDIAGYAACGWACSEPDDEPA